MEKERSPLEGTWLIETSQCRCLPVRAELDFHRSADAQAEMSVTWRDADQKASMTRHGGSYSDGRAIFRFSTPDGEKHLLVAALHEEPGQRRRLFGFVTSRRGREDTGTGAWTANDVDPDNPPQIDHPPYSS